MGEYYARPMRAAMSAAEFGAHCIMVVMMAIAVDCNYGNSWLRSFSNMAVEEEDDVVIRMINSASALRSETLDLSKKRIYEIPKEILDLKHLEVRNSMHRTRFC